MQTICLRDLIPNKNIKLEESVDFIPPIPDHALEESFNQSLQKMVNKPSHLGKLIAQQNRINMMKEVEEDKMQKEQVTSRLPQENEEVKKTTYEIFQEMEDKNFYIGV